MRSITRRSLLGGSLAASAGLISACTQGDGELPGRLSSLDVLPSAVRDKLDAAMRRAVAAVPASGYPFGAVLVGASTGEVIAAAGNQTTSGDPSAHAEVDVLRQAGLAGVDLTSTLLITTAESCAMCAACAVWAGVQGVVYGTSIAFLKQSGWEQLDITQPQIVATSWLSMPVVGGYLREVTDPLYSDGPPA
ncbi:MAG: nucleoside deaminase [Candidatus Nanopelagicales bacterium]|jgi:tRNA(adenine34) deaminase|nr:nucleoside deaminase [Candidatus Nanopelagicales bacterium]